MKALLFILVIGNLLLFGLAFAPDPDAPEQNFVPPTPPGVHPLQLLSERTAPESVESINSEEVVSQDKSDADKPETSVSQLETITKKDEPVENKQPPQTEPVCHTIGPFADKGAADSLKDTLKVGKEIMAMRQSEIQEPAGYWVYLPSMQREKAEEIVESLIDNKVEDYFVGAQNYISLGIYSSHDTAQERFEQISELGYNPKLDQRFKIRKVYWLDVEEPEPPFLTDGEWAKLLETNTGVRRQILACE